MVRSIIIIFLSLIISGTLGAQGINSAITTATVVSEIGVTDLGGNNVFSFNVDNNDLQSISTERIRILSNIKTVEILSFKVISNENNFSITIPSTFYFKKENGLDDMNVELYVTPFENKNNTQLISITSVFDETNIQAPGNYSSSPLEITVNYN